MTDPRLNSIHLESTRRQEFRSARDALLNGRGDQTLMGEKLAGFASGPPNRTAVEQPAAAVDAQFVLMDKDFVFPLKIGLNTVGRMPDNDVVVDDGYVSRRHCAVLVHADGRCELQDVASKNGTFLNGSKIAGPTALKSSDEIRMCSKTLVFISRAQGPAEPQPHNTLVE
jgi:hypothetical protein